MADTYDREKADAARAALDSGRTALGIELGSTRIKAVLIGPGGSVVAIGSHEWENQFVDGCGRTPGRRLDGPAGLLRALAADVEQPLRQSS